MKKYLLTLIICQLMVTSFAQNFKQNATSAKVNYTSKNLTEARFTIQQMLQQIDEQAAKDILKLYPKSFLSLEQEDEGHITGSGLGTYVIKEYNSGNSTAQVSTYFNSPIAVTISTLISMNQVVGNPNQKVIKVGAYKGLLEKIAEDDEIKYTLQIPISASLISIESQGQIEELDFTQKLNTIPIEKIAELLK